MVPLIKLRNSNTVGGLRYMFWEAGGLIRKKKNGTWVYSVYEHHRVSKDDGRKPRSMFCLAPGHQVTLSSWDWQMAEAGRK